MTFTSLAQLEKALQQRLRKATEIANDKALKDLYEGTSNFYKTTPVKYVQTGALANTPSSTSVSHSGKTSSFEVYLDDNYTYSTGSNPSMSMILNSAVYKSPYANLLNSLQWDAMQSSIENDVDNTFKSFFE